MSNYYTLKNSIMFEPIDQTEIGGVLTNFKNLYLNGNIIVDGQTYNSSIVCPRISAIFYANSAYATNPSGGETITVKGDNFKPNCTVRLDNQVVSANLVVITYKEITFTAPAKNIGNYTFTVTNTDGGVGCYVPGIDYSLPPTWITGSGNLAEVYETQLIDTQLQVVERNIPNTFGLVSGQLPAGVSLDGHTGKIFGYAPIVYSIREYNFTIEVSDYQNQRTRRSFSYTVYPANVEWMLPGEGSTYTQDQFTSFSIPELLAFNPIGSPITYSATNLHGGLTVNNNGINGYSTITGTLNTSGTRNVTLTASAPAVNKSANRTITITSLPPMSASSRGTLLSAIENYEKPEITRNSNLWLVPQVVGAQAGDLVFLAYFAFYDNFGEPAITDGFYGLSSMIARSNIAQLRIAMAVQMKILDSADPIEISRGSVIPRNQSFVAQIWRPSRPISSLSVYALNEQTFEDGVTGFPSGQPLVQMLDGTGLQDYTRFHIAVGACEDSPLPQLQTSIPTFSNSIRDLTAWKGYWPTSNWPEAGTPPAGSYAYIDRGGNFGSPWGQFCLTRYNKGTAGVSQQVISGTNNRGYNIEYSQMSAIVIIE